ncbi:MAG: hypothetical protein IPP41_11810 [Rhodocyclaceae bacterium]|nr:hypothetical protein [Rhodocyclaceae bacterium]
MRKAHFTFSCGTQLSYLLNNTQTTASWCHQFAQMTPQLLFRQGINHRHGFATPQEIDAAISRLKTTTEFLGFEMQTIRQDNWHEVLNDLHLNFPGFFKTNRDEKRFHAAHVMNLLIHWLEYELANLYDDKAQYLFNLDFNHYPPAYNLKTQIPDDEFDHFSAALEFGNLHLHYIYIGRHFLEMFDARDFVSPGQHFRAQHEINATCALVFSEPVDAARLNNQMQEYFDQRGGNSFFGFDFDDPRLAKGFFKIGQLENLDHYRNASQRTALREQLKGSSIVQWQLE